MFLKVPGVEGESKTKGHDKELEVENFHWGAHHSSSAGLGGGASTGVTQLGDFTFSTKTGNGMPTMIQKMFKGEHFKEPVVFCMQKATGDNLQEDYLKISFKDAFFSNASLGGSANHESDLPLTISYTAVKIEFKTQNADGSLGAWKEAKWDQKQAKDTF